MLIGATSPNYQVSSCIAKGSSTLFCNKLIDMSMDIVAWQNCRSSRCSHIIDMSFNLLRKFIIIILARFVAVLSTVSVYHLHSFYKNVWCRSVFSYFSCNDCILKHSACAKVGKKGQEDTGFVRVYRLQQIQRDKFHEGFNFRWWRSPQFWVLIWSRVSKLLPDILLHIWGNFKYDWSIWLSHLTSCTHHQYRSTYVYPSICRSAFFNKNQQNVDHKKVARDMCLD